MAIIRVIVDRQRAATMRLPSLPAPGDLLEVADGMPVVVREIELVARGIIDAEVHAQLAA